MFKRTSLGVLAGILFMGTEGLGSLYLIRALLQGTDASQASQFTLVTYLWLAFNVLGNALGFVAARSAARLGHRQWLGALATNIQRLGQWLLLPAAGSMLLGLLGLWAFAAWPSSQAGAWLLFLAGHLVRMQGLLRIYVHVGDGQIGADKWYQLGCTALFYGLAIPAALQGASLPVLACAYAVSAGLTQWGAWRWQKGRWPDDPNDTGSNHVETPRALGKQCAAMVGYAGAGFLAGNADALVARILLADHAFVQYALAAKLGQVVALVAGLFPAMMGPRITRLHHQGQTVGLAQARRLSLLVAVALGLAGGLTLIALQDPVARWLSPQRHEVLDEMLWIAAAGAVLQAAGLSLANAVNSVGGAGLVVVTLFSAASALLVASLAGSAWGAAGIAVGTVAGSVVMLLGLRQISLRTFAGSDINPGVHK